MDCDRIVHTVSVYECQNIFYVSGLVLQQSCSFCISIVSISLKTAVIPRRNEKQRLCKILGGQIRCIMGVVQVVNKVVL